MQDKITRQGRNIMKKYIMIIMAVIGVLGLSYSAEAYTREELEEQVRNEMRAGYETSQINQEKLAEAQSVLDGLDEQKAAALKELEEKVRNDEITDSEYKKQKKEVESNFKDLEKTYEKLVDGYQEKIDDFNKELNKQLEEVDRKMEKQEKNADKAEEKVANLNKALAECEAMAASSAKRQECADKAAKKYKLSEEEQAALAARDQEKAAAAAAAAEAAEKAYQQAMIDGMEEDPEEDQVVRLEDGSLAIVPVGGNTEGTENPTDIAGVSVASGGDSDTLSGGNASNPSSYGKGTNGLSGCTSGDIFDQITCKVLGFLSDLRVLAYVISGFGMIVFTYGAIFNKINWKHFSYIAIGLFLLSVMGSFIQYFSGDNTAATVLGYGNHMSGSYSQISGSSGGGSAVSGGDIPNVNVGNNSTADIIGGGNIGGEGGASNTTAGSGKGFSLKDVASSVSSGLDVVRDVYNAATTAKEGVDNIKNVIADVTNAVKNNETDLGGLIDTATSIAGAINSGTFEARNDIYNIVNKAESAANNAQDVFSTAEEKAENEKLREDGTATNKVAEWLQGKGANAKETASDVHETASNTAGSVGNVANTTHEGQMIGGDTLGGIMGTAQGVIEITK